MKTLVLYDLIVVSSLVWLLYGHLKTDLPTFVRSTWGMGDDTQFPALMVLATVVTPAVFIHAFFTSLEAVIKASDASLPWYIIVIAIINSTFVMRTHKRTIRHASFSNQRVCLMNIWGMVILTVTVLLPYALVSS